MAQSPTFPADPIVDGDTAGGLITAFTFAIADVASQDFDVVLDHKIEVVEILVHKRGGAGGAANTVQVKNVANAISEAMSLNVAQDAVVRNATNTFANAVIDPAAGGKLRFSLVKAGGNAACFVIVNFIRRN